MTRRGKLIAIPPTISKLDVEAASRVLRSLDEMIREANDSGMVTLPNRAQQHMLIPQDLLIFARRLKSLRNERAVLFDPALFGEPGWDMLLALYIAEGEGYRLKITDLVEESGAAPTTALRWITKLEELDLIVRRPHPTDHRAAHVELAEGAIPKLTTYLTKVKSKYALVG